MTDRSPQKLFNRDTIQKKLSLDAVVERVEQAFRAQAREEVQMPAKNYLMFDSVNGDLRSMSAFVPEFELATVKVVNSHPNNPAQHELPTVMALVVAVDPETGYPTAVLDGTELTAMRTAAASAVATKAFTPDDVSSLGIIGAGGQASSQVEGQLIVREFSTVLVHDLDSSKSQALCEKLTDVYSEIEFKRVDELEQLIQQSQVINSLTPSREPLVEAVPPDASLLHLNAMGADGPGKQEWPVSFLKDASIHVDGWEQARHSGEIHTGLKDGSLIEEDVEGTLGDQLEDDSRPTETVTVFDSTGLAIQDTAAAKALLTREIDPDDEFAFF